MEMARQKNIADFFLPPFSFVPQNTISLPVSGKKNPMSTVNRPLCCASLALMLPFFSLLLFILLMFAMCLWTISQHPPPADTIENAFPDFPEHNELCRDATLSVLHDMMNASSLCTLARCIIPLGINNPLHAETLSFCFSNDAIAHHEHETESSDEYISRCMIENTCPITALCTKDLFGRLMNIVSFSTQLSDQEKQNYLYWFKTFAKADALRGVGYLLNKDQHPDFQAIVQRQLDEMFDHDRCIQDQKTQLHNMNRLSWTKTRRNENAESNIEPNLFRLIVDYLEETPLKKGKISAEERETFKRRWDISPALGISYLLNDTKTSVDDRHKKTDEL